jgi:hypothetical protein
VERALNLFGVTNNLDFLILVIDNSDCGYENVVDKLRLFLFLSSLFLLINLVIDNFNWGHSPGSPSQYYQSPKVITCDGAYGLIRVWCMIVMRFMIIVEWSIVHSILVLEFLFGINQTKGFDWFFVII